MIRVSRGSLWVAVVLSGALLHTAVAQTPETLEGRWRLVWNSYGEGRNNLTSRTRSVFLEIGPGPAGIDVRTWSDGDPAAASSWPQVITDTGPVAIEVLERVIDPAQRMVRVSYRVPPAAPDALTIDIVEEYRLDPETDSLIGTQTVRMYRGGERRGGYVLHRVFERQR